MVFRRFNRGNALRPIQRIKHVIDKQGATVFNNQENIDLIQSTDTPTIAAEEQCITGSKVNGIYLHVEVYASTAGALANCYMYVFKNPGNQLTAPAVNNVGASVLKKYIIHQEMVMLERQINGNPRTLFNGVIVIPKGYIRNGPGDRLKLVLFAPGVNIEWCIQCHYKEFR